MLLTKGAARCHHTTHFCWVGGGGINRRKLTIGAQERTSNNSTHVSLETREWGGQNGVVKTGWSKRSGQNGVVKTVVKTGWSHNTTQQNTTQHNTSQHNIGKEETYSTVLLSKKKHYWTILMFSGLSNIPYLFYHFSGFHLRHIPVHGNPVWRRQVQRKPLTK